MRSSLSYRAAIVAIFIFALLAVWFAAAKIEQVHEQAVATDAMKTLEAIQLGSTSKTQAEGLLRKYSKYRVKDLNDDGIQLGFVNRRWLPVIRSSQWIWITLEFKDNVVVTRSVQFAEAPRRSASVRQSLQAMPVMSIGGVEKHRDVILAGSVSAPYSIVKVYEDATISAEQRAADWTVDFQCFQFVSSCLNVANVLAGAKIDQRSWS